MADEIVQLFEGLSRENRQAALRGLRNCLSKYEWRQMHTQFAKRTFQFDIIGSKDTPLEIVILIFARLPFTAAVTNQRVSRNWRYKLNSVRTLNVLLAKAGYQSSIPFRYQQSPGISDGLMIARADMERFMRLQYGRPKAIFEIRSPAPNQGLGDMKLSANFLAWDVRDGRSFVILDLQGLTHQKFSLPGRVKGKLVAMTEAFITVQADTTVYAYPLLNVHEPPARLRLPTFFTYMASDQHLSVFAPYDGKSISREIVVWDMLAKRSHSFKVNSHCEFCSRENEPNLHGLAGLWIHASSGTITLFYSCSCDSYKHTYLKIAQTNLEGSTICSERLHFDNSDGLADFMSRDGAYMDLETIDSIAPSNFREHRNQRLRVTPLNNSAAIHVAIGYQLWDWDREVMRTIVFKMVASSVTQFQPARTRVWMTDFLDVDDAREEMQYVGLKPVDPATQIDSSGSAQSEHLCHTFIPSRSVLLYSLDPILAIWSDFYLGGKQARIPHYRWRQVYCSASHGSITYHMLSTNKWETGCMEFEAYKTSCWHDDDKSFLVPTVSKRVGFKVTSPASLRTCNRAVSRACATAAMNDSFVVMKVITAAIVDESAVDDQAVFKVLAFDPDFALPPALCGKEFLEVE